ncbi:MAG: helix-turn-helix transcriptional regulator [Bacteroidia bacterium]|nr:helix-turn-helix transcriptional regulator [Bacteroidia bacterium]MBP9690011.1 helix-turn-helix transcriptional regulator [Bacteroidia bacterium]
MNPQYNQQNLKITQVLKLLRKHKKIKALEVAIALNCSESYYCRIENGGVEIAFWQVISICDVLQCSVLQVCILADIDILKNGTIKTWDEFLDSINNCNEDERKQLLELTALVFEKP